MNGLNFQKKMRKNKNFLENKLLNLLKFVKLLKIIMGFLAILNGLLQKENFISLKVGRLPH